MNHALKNMVPDPEVRKRLVEQTNPKLLEIISRLYWFCGEHLPSPKGVKYPQVVCASRTIAEQKSIDESILAKDPSYKAQGLGSLHLFGNAFDLSVRDQFGTPFDSHEINMIIAFIDAVCPYDYKDIPAAYRHVGTGDHIHVQVNMRRWGQGKIPE